MFAEYAAKIGYVTKMYPRFSETFIVTEILAREAAGEDIVIFSLRAPIDPRFHAELARVAAPVLYLDRPTKPATLWDALRAAASHPRLVRGMATHLEELLAAEADDAVQAILLAERALAAGITHLHAHFASLATTVARLASLLTGIPYSFTAHAKDIFHEEVDPVDLARKLADAAFIATVSDFNLAHLRRTFPLHAGRVVRVYNGLELARFPVRDALIRTGPLRVLAVGRLVEKKGFGLLLDAVQRIRGEGGEVIVDLVGGGEGARALEAQIERLGLGAVVTLHGPLPQSEVADRLRRADVFVAPCLVAADGNADGLPTVLLEAMATGTPCISTDVTGIPEVIQDGRTGILCRAGHLDDLVQALRSVAEPTWDPTPLVRRARALIEERFDATRQAQQLARLTRQSAAATHQEVA